MKPTTLLLAASLLANAALAVVLVVHSSDSAADAASSSGTSSTDSKGALIAADSKSGTTAATASSGSSGKNTSWDRLHTDDLSALAARLREGGFPPAAIRRIIGTLVSERFDSRRLELEKSLFEAPLVSGLANGYADPKIGPELLRLQREQAETLKKILGGNLLDSFTDTEDSRATLQLQVGNLSPEKVDRLYGDVMGYSEKMTAIYAASRNSGLNDGDRVKLAAAERDLRESMGKFLTPSEVDEFLMRSTANSGQLLQTLVPFRASEQEYRTLFPIYQAFQSQFPQQGDLPPAEADARRIARDQMNNQLTLALGADRAAEFQQAIDPKSQQLNRLVSRLDLPLSAAVQVNAVQADVQQRVTALRADTSLAQEQRIAQLGAIAQDATTRISAALGGSRGLEAYKQYGGQWLNNLTPRPPATAPKR